MRRIKILDKTLTSANFRGSTTIDQGRRQFHYRVRHKTDNSIHDVVIRAGRSMCSCPKGIKCKAIIKAKTAYAKVSKNLNNMNCGYRNSYANICFDDPSVVLDDIPLCEAHYCAIVGSR